MKIHPEEVKLFHKNRLDKADSCSFHLVSMSKKALNIKLNRKIPGDRDVRIRLGKISDRKNHRGGNRGESAALGRQ
jgi:PIN domain nuclease of toxin-antitoxin system